LFYSIFTILSLFLIRLPFHNMYRYISNLSEDDKVSNSEYERRLKKCGECTNLLNGICRICGCFVEMRAAIAVKHCPNSVPKW
jgi:hypothetical protein